VAGRTAAALALSAVAVTATALSVSAQSLARLTVQSFVLSTDNPRPRLDVPFHLIVTLHVRERVTQIANLELPMLADLELLGDERETVSGTNGTQYRETITVVAHRAGPIAIAPATLQAIDARDGKPKQWYTNGLTLSLTGVSAPVLRHEAGEILGVLWRALRVLLWVLGIACLVAIVALLMRRRARRPGPPAPPMPESAPAPLQRSPREQVADALTVLRAERTRGAAIAVRGAVWRMLGASDGETLGDVLKRRQASDPMLRDLLIALERSAFTYDDDLRGAIDDACSALQRYAESLP
jgi:hypothetical protein